MNRTDTYFILISPHQNYLFLSKIPGNPTHNVLSSSVEVHAMSAPVDTTLSKIKGAK